MEVGISLRHTLQSSPGLLLELARTAETVGFHSVWVPHHTLVPAEYESRYPYQTDHRLPFPSDTTYCDALSVLGYVAASTEHIRLGTNVIPMLTQHPIGLAKQAATIDHLSDGRLELGLGGGWLKEEGEILGLPTDRRGPRLDDAIDIMRKAWTGEAFTHESQFWAIPSVYVCPRPAQGPDIPIWIGGGSPAARRTMLSRGTGAMLPPGPPGEELLREIAPALTRAGKQAAMPIAVPVEFDAAALAAQCETMRKAGATMLVLYTDVDPGRALATVERFGHEILPLLPQSQNVR